MGAAGRTTYVLKPDSSHIIIHVGKSGLLSFAAGHEHEVVAPCQGEIVADFDAIGASSVHLTFEATSLRVSARNEPPKDLPQVQEAMVGPKVLDAARFPTITFDSTSVSGQGVSPLYEVTVAGLLNLHGVTGRLSIPARVEIVGDEIHITGRTSLKQTDFRMSPLSVAGVVKVRNELTMDFDILAKAQSAGEDSSREKLPEEPQAQGSGRHEVPSDAHEQVREFRAGRKPSR